MATIDNLTTLAAGGVSDTDIVYVGIPGDADPDRQMTITQLRAYLDDYFALLTGATFTGTVTAPTVNGSTEVQEGGTALSSKYAALSGATFTGYVTARRSDPRFILDRESGSSFQYGFVRAEDAGTYRGQIAYDYVNDIWAIGEGGAPADQAIAEYGSNSNGAYVRYYNGVQICWHEFASGTGTESWTFPAAFNATPDVHGSAGTNSPGSTAYVASIDNDSRSTTSVTVARNGTTCVVYAYAIGTWA